MTEEIDQAKHLLRKCTHGMQDLLEAWDKIPHAQRMKLVEHITREFQLLEEALQEQSRPRRLTMLEHIFMGGILATLAVHVLFKFIAA